MRSQVQHSVVSFDSDSLILVDEEDHEIGYQDKLTCHDKDGLLHRAFSLFIFNDDGELLLQQRSRQKRLWPLYWSNSCCSHPRRGEDMAQACRRRLSQELGLDTALEYLYKFKYQVPYLNLGAEHELCSVFVGRCNGPVLANENEIASWRFISGRALELELENQPQQFTPWFLLEWQELKTTYSRVLERYRVVL